MKYCKNCGNQMEDQAVFCTNCGAQFSDNQSADQSADPATSAPAQSAGAAQPTSYPVQSYAPVNQFEPKPQPVSTLGFIGRSLIPLIPFVGGIVYIIMLFIWSGDKTKEESFRNWAKAQLIMMLIVIVLTIIVFVIIFAFVGTVAGSKLSAAGNYY